MAAAVASPPGGTNLAMFTLTQKVFAVQSYYKGNDSIRKAMEAMHRRYGVKMNSDNLRTIGQIVRTFESTGTILNRFFYNTSDPTAQADKKAKVKIEFEHTGKVEMVDSQPVAPAEKKLAKPTEYEVEEDPEKDIIEYIPEEEMIVEVLSEFDNTESTTANEESAEVVFLGETETDTGVEAEGEAESEVKAKIIERGRSHSKGRDSLCTICGEHVPFNKYTRHRRIVHGEEQDPNKLRCTVCSEVFEKRTELYQHRKQHFPEKYTFICEICGKVSGTNAHHKYHMLSHSTERPHKCPHCPQAFARIATLKKHIMTHTGEKPLKCKFCGVGFLAHMTLNMHMRLHTGERPYTCEHCGLKFVGKPSLNTHLKKYHDSEYPFECGICAGRFKTDKTMKEHLQRKHNVPHDEIVVTTQTE